MKKQIIVGIMLVLLCVNLSACKSSDYDKALELQQAGNYTEALAIYEGLDGYKDSANQITICKEMIAAIARLEAAWETVSEKNVALDTVVKEAEQIISENPPMLDSNRMTELEAATMECRAQKREAPETPGTADEINTLAEKLEGTDYTAFIEKLTEKIAVAKTSAEQFALVFAPSESYIIDCLRSVDCVVEIAAATEDNDPNGHLNKPNWYTAHVFFSVDLLDQSEIYGDTLFDKATSAGGSIEVYTTVEDAVQRDEYLASFDGTVFTSGSHIVIGSVVVRTSDKLTASQQKALEASIIEALTNLDN